MEAICSQAKAVAGGPTALADKLSARSGRRITSQAVSQWKAVPPAWASDVAAITGIPIEDLRPDLAALFRAATARQPVEADEVRP